MHVDDGTIIDDHRRITQAYYREVYRHNLERPKKELQDEAQRYKFRTPEKLLAIVRRRQAAERLRIAMGMEKPKTLKEWAYLESNPAIDLTEDDYLELYKLAWKKSL